MFSRGLRRARESKSLTQTELAQRVGVTQAAISGYEKGTKMPTLDVAALIADTLKCSIDELLERSAS